MSQDNVETLRRGIEAFNRGDWEASLAEIHPEVKWHSPSGVPDAGVYHGHEGVKRFFAGWAEAFKGFRTEIEEMIDGGDRVTAVTRPVGTGAASGIPMEGGVLSQTAEFRDGKIVRLTMTVGRP